MWNKNEVWRASVEVLTSAVTQTRVLFSADRLSINEVWRASVEVLTSAVTQTRVLFSADRLSL